MKSAFVDLITILHADFDFQTLYPCPYRDALGEPIDERCYEWCLENWGTRDAATNIHMAYDEENSVLHVEFMAEAMPYGLFAHLRLIYPKLRIE